MIPLGYMLKQVASPAPEWMNSPAVRSVHSLSNCVSNDFVDYIPLWKHNGWWLFDSGDVVMEVARSQGVAPENVSLFYYEAFDKQYDADQRRWVPFAPEAFATNVVAPPVARLSGFDVVTFYVGTSPECSPLSCCGLAADLAVNERCLFDTFEEAFTALERGDFENSEPGPYRIVGVYEVAPALLKA